MTKSIVGIDVGGTFTDIAVLTDGRLEVHKLPSTPRDPSIGILQGVTEACPELLPKDANLTDHIGGVADGVGASGADFVHGSTVATNALLEGKGGRTALVTTLGFEDVLEIGRQSRAELYNLEMDRPPALAPWELRLGIHSGDLVAGVQGAGVSIVAGRRAAPAGPGLTGLTRGAELTVITGGAVRGRLGLASVGRLVADPEVAGVVQRGAVGGASPFAGARVAGLAGVAELPVVTGGPIERERIVDAAGDEVAAVRGAGVTVVAVEASGSAACAPLADVVRVAPVPVITSCAVCYRLSLAGV